MCLEYGSFCCRVEYKVMVIDDTDVVSQVIAITLVNLSIDRVSTN